MTVSTLATYAAAIMLIFCSVWLGLIPLENTLRKWEAGRQMNASSQTVWRLDQEPTRLVLWAVAILIASIVAGAALKHLFGVDTLASGLALGGA